MLLAAENANTDPPPSFFSGSAVPIDPLYRFLQ
jgi:hypothetical protein